MSYEAKVFIEAQHPLAESIHWQEEKKPITLGRSVESVFSYLSFRFRRNFVIQITACHADRIIRVDQQSERCRSGASQWAFISQLENDGNHPIL